MLIRTATREIEVEVTGQRCFMPCDTHDEASRLAAFCRERGHLTCHVPSAGDIGVLIHLGEATLAQVRDVLIARDAL